MQIYVDGLKQDVTVLSGTQNPTSLIASGTECYIGHDSISTIDELSISNTALIPYSNPLRLEGWFWAATIGAFAAFALIVFFFSKRTTKTTKP